MAQDRVVDTFYPARTRLINRTAEMRLIHEAINSKKNHAIFFIADGGIGKTRLLEEVLAQHNFLESRGMRCSDLIDLFHPVYHNPDNVQFHIAEQIDPTNRFFQEYRLKRAAFLSAEEKGVERKKLADLAEKRDMQFLEDYRALTEIGKAHVLLIFDTTEQIQHESDVVQELFGTQTENLAIHAWLTNRAPLLPNTVILLAGRPKPKIEAQIQEGFKSKEWNFQQKNLGTFEQKDAFEYIDALLQDQPLPQAITADQKEWIFKITYGKPIRLALVLQFISYRGIQELQLAIEREKDLDKILIEHLNSLPGEYGGAMPYMLVARNGMDASLLKHLTDWPEEKIKKFFEEMQTNVLFRPRGDNLFLHDELYELHDRYFRNHAPTARAFAIIAAYYQNLLKDEPGYLKQLELRVLALFYELRQHLEQGYQTFATWDEEVIWLHFKSADLRLRDEMLKFTNRYLRASSLYYDELIAAQVSAETIDTDNAIRCIEREIADGNFSLAKHMGETVLQTSVPLFAARLAQDPLYKARILYGCAEAAQYSGLSAVTQQYLEEVIRLLENYQPASEAQKFWQARTLGRAYNRFGFSYRVSGHYAKATPSYRKAVTEFRKVKLDYMLAQTLTNLAYILALTGDNETAFEHVQTALKIYARYGLSYRRVLSQSCLSRILVEANRPLAARKELEEARAIVVQLDDAKAMVKVMIGDGRALRKLGNLWKDNLAMYSKEEADAYFQKGENTLLEAEKAQAALGETAEALDWWEIYNELGSLYCDWAWLHRSRDARILASTCYIRSIEYQEKACEIIRNLDMPFQAADSLDDLAQAYGDRAFFLLEDNRRTEAYEELRKAEQHMALAEATVPANFRSFGRTGLLGEAQTNKREEGAPYWLVLGKSHLWRGVWKFRQLEYEGRLSLDVDAVEIEQATELLLTSQAYFKRYGENSALIDRNMRYLSRFMQAIDAPYSWMEEQIKKVEDKYNTTLPIVRMRMQNKLGF